MSALPIFIAAATIMRNGARDEDERRAKKHRRDETRADDARAEAARTDATDRIAKDAGPGTTIRLINEYSRRERPDLDALCAELGLGVRRLKLHADVFATIDHDRRLVILNKDTSAERQRFMLAHQIGHWMYDRETLRVHGGTNDGKDCRSMPDAPNHAPSMTDADEIRASKTGIHLIMSELVVGRLHAEGLVTAEIAKRLETTKAAMAIRLGTLGLEDRS